jgi:hypothetical protein
VIDPDSAGARVQGARPPGGLRAEPSACFGVAGAAVGRVWADRMSFGGGAGWIATLRSQ